jgi:UDP-N-acetylglucosamine--N-acetylmuramyl-(pentapeptide) pyrophosphoryl-undecaprenol N-acetylglucosamine transferase
MEKTFAWSDIIICRAGALTVAEVAGAARVAIFVPLPIAVDDHQTENAKYLSEQGGALLIPQAKLESNLLEELIALSESPSRRNDIASKARALAHENATDRVAEFIKTAANSSKDVKIDKATD